VRLGLAVVARGPGGVPTSLREEKKKLIGESKANVPLGNNAIAGGKTPKEQLGELGE